MTLNNNLSILPFYPSVEMQNHRKSYAYGDVYPLFCPNRKLLPFQIVRNHRYNPIQKVEIYYKNGTLFQDITTGIVGADLQIVSVTAYGYDVILNFGRFTFPFDTPQGQYYVHIFDGVEHFYSDIYTVVWDMTGYLKIEYWDDDNMYYEGGAIIYNTGFRNTVYLCSQLGKPDYEFEEEGENRDGYFFPEKQISEKTYHFIFLAPEYLCDAMRIIRMSDNVLVTNLGITYNCDTFLITPKWQTQGNLASVEVEFKTATVIKKIGRGVIIGTGGDFNSDFNNDFNNKTIS